MHIIFSNYDDIKNPYYGGGGAFAVHEVAKRLAVHHTVTVLTGTYPGAKNEIIDRVRYERVWSGFLGARCGQLFFQFALPFLVTRKQFDVWVESFTPPFSTGFLPLFTKRPVVAVTHLLGGVAMKEKYGLPFDLVERFGLRFYKDVIVLQEQLQKQVRTINPQIRTHIIPNGVDPAIFTQASAKKENYIAFLGRMDLKQKGLDLLLEAYKIAGSRLPYKLKIAGTGLPAEVAELRKQVQKFGLETSVEICGKLTGQAKYDFLNRAQFLVMPSRVENFALVLLEGMAFGLPSVVFNIPGVSWSPETAVLKVEAFDVEKYAVALVTLSRDEVQKAAMSQEARKTAARYNWDAIADEYERTLKLIAGT